MFQIVVLNVSAVKNVFQSFLLSWDSILTLIGMFTEYNNGAGESICGNQFTGVCCFEDHASGECNCDTGENAFTLPYETLISTIGILPQSDATQLAVSMTTISSLLRRGITEGTLPASSSTGVAIFTSQSKSSTTSSLNCVQCPTEAPSCPSCAADEVCSVRIALCHSCASTTCVAIASLPIASQQGTKHLSTGADAGIAVGVVLLIAMLSVLGFRCFRARRRANIGGLKEYDAYLKPELATEGSEVRTWRNPPAELPSSLHRWSQRPMADLPTSLHRWSQKPMAELPT